MCLRFGNAGRAGLVAGAGADAATGAATGTASGGGGNVFAGITVDTLDDYTFPKSGFTFSVNSIADLSEGADLLGNRAIDFSFVGARTFGDTTFVPIVSGAFALEPSNGDIGGAFAGGFLNLSGLPRNARQGRHAALGALALRGADARAAPARAGRGRPAGRPGRLCQARQRLAGLIP